MDLGHYQCRTQMNTLPPNVQHDGNPLPSSRTEFLMPSYDGLPRIPLDQSLLNNNWEPNYNNYNIGASSMSSSQSSSAWPASYDIGSNSQYYNYNTGSYDSSLPRNQFGNTPRTLPCDGDLYNGRIMPPRSVYDTPSYVMELERQGVAYSSLNSQLHEASERVRDLARLSISPSAKDEDDNLPEVSFLEYPAPSQNPSSVASDEIEPSSREMTVVEADEHGGDEPYAKLIYRALMSAPDHSMVLQEIYQWFRENTTKGSSDTKGWMNSIRHNLSMNAVSSSKLPSVPKLTIQGL